jgi:nucleoside-diphosphate-sugar epimerase
LEIVSRFVTNAINKEPIKIIGGKQVFSNMDVRDAASGILALIKTDRKKWKKVYNLGCEWRHSIIEIAEIVKEIAKEYNKNVKIVIEEKDVYLDSGMDSTLFYKDTGWKPKYNMKDIVKNLFDYLLEDRND